MKKLNFGSLKEKQQFLDLIFAVDRRWDAVYQHIDDADADDWVIVAGAFQEFCYEAIMAIAQIGRDEAKHVLWQMQEELERGPVQL